MDNRKIYKLAVPYSLWRLCLLNSLETFGRFDLVSAIQLVSKQRQTSFPSSFSQRDGLDRCLSGPF